MADVKVEKTTSEQNRHQNRPEEQRSMERRRTEEPQRMQDMFAANPFSLMRRLSEEMDRAFASSFGLWRPTGREMHFAPAIEVREEANNLVICADLPGIKKEDVRVECTNEGIAIEGERKQESEENRRGVHRTERSYGHFYRMIPLPEDAAVDQAKAQFKDGVLEVRIPLSESRKRKEIPISS